MGAVAALSDAADALGRTPALLAGALAVTGVTAALFAGVGALAGPVPLAALGLVAGYVLVEPLLAGGFLGLADEAVSGETGFGAFTRHAVGNYGPLLAGRLVVGTLAVAVVGVTLVAGTALGVSMVPDPATGPPMHDPLGGVGYLFAGAVVAVLLVGPLALVGHVLLQFYPAGVVVGDEGVVGSFRYSLGLVRAHPLSVLGYTVAAFVGGVVLAVAGGVLVGLVADGTGMVGGGTGMAGGDAGVVGGATGTAGGLLASPFAGGAAVVGGGWAPAGGGPAAAVGAVVGTLVATVRVALVRTYYVAFVRSVDAE